MRAAREKLTSSVGLERAFEHELVSIFAQYHLSAWPILVILAMAVTAAATFWEPLPYAVRFHLHEARVRLRQRLEVRHD